MVASMARPTPLANDPPDKPGVMAPPPIIYAAGFALGLAAQYFYPLPLTATLPRVIRIALVVLLLGCGIVLGLAALLSFRRAGTAVEPWKPSTALVAKGPYRLSRNPIYVGMTAVVLALAFALDNAWVIVFLLPTLVAIRYGVIAREEAYLERKFGDAYRRYKNTVRRWL